MIIDKNNIADFVGKTVDAKRRCFHHYPLTILKKPWGYCFCDRTGTVVNFNNGETIYYDFVIGEKSGASMEKDNLKAGTRYWFWSGYRVRSGLYGGETDPHNDNVIICEKNGTRWSIPAKDLYECEEDVVKSRKG